MDRVVILDYHKVYEADPRTKKKVVSFDGSSFPDPAKCIPVRDGKTAERLPGAQNQHIRRGPTARGGPAVAALLGRHGVRHGSGAARHRHRDLSHGGRP